MATNSRARFPIFRAFYFIFSHHAIVILLRVVLFEVYCPYLVAKCSDWLDLLTNT